VSFWSFPSAPVISSVARPLKIHRRSSFHRSPHFFVTCSETPPLPFLGSLPASISNEPLPAQAASFHVTTCGGKTICLRPTGTRTSRSMSMRIVPT
jgi:hypothetical protein